MKNVIKTLAVAMALLMVSGCSFGKDVKNPVLELPAFDLIGDQGIKEDVTLEELQSKYSGTLRFEEHQSRLYDAGSYKCKGWIEGNVLMFSWEMDGMTFENKEGIEFQLEDGIMMSAEEPDPSLICAVKVYPSGHMLDGLVVLDIDDGKEVTEVRVHFQLIK